MIIEKGRDIPGIMMTVMQRAAWRNRYTYRIYVIADGQKGTGQKAPASAEVILFS